MWNKNNFNDRLSELVGNNFLFIPEWGRWEKKMNDKTLNIHIGYNEYNLSLFYVKGISADIYFNEVEQILEKYELGQEYKSTFGKSFQNEDGINYDVFATEINSNESFDIVKPIMNEIIVKAAIPFLHRFSDLEVVANFLADKKIEEIVPYIQGGILLPKTVLILKLTNHPQFLIRLKEFRNVLLEYSSNERYKILLEKYDKLFQADLSL